MNIFGPQPLSILKKFILICLVVHGWMGGALAQPSLLVDSLQKALKKYQDTALELGKSRTFAGDTIAADLLYELSRATWGSEPELSIDYARQCQALSEQIGYKKGLGNALYSLGANSWFKGDYMVALDFFKQALNTHTAIGERRGIATSNNGIGNIYVQLGNYPEALKYHLASLRMREEIGDKKEIATSYNNIGVVYEKQGNYPEALKNNFASLKIREEIGDMKGVSGSYNNIGNIYKYQGKYDEALKFHSDALEINLEMNDIKGVADSYNNIGTIYESQGDFGKALTSQLEALKIREEMGDKYGKSMTFINIGNVYAGQNKFDKAREYLEKGLALSEEIGSVEGLKLCYESLAIIDNVQGKYKLELEHYKLFIKYRDSLLNNENTQKTVQMQMQYDFDKKESLTRVEQEKKDVLAQKKVQKQRLVRNAFIGGTFLFLMLAGAIFIGLRRTAGAKRKSEELLLNILPGEVAEEIKTTGTAKTKSFTMVTVMFTDFKDFTNISEKVSAELLVDEIHACFSGFDKIIQKHKIEKIKTIGDAYLCASGLPVSNYTHAVDMINAAFEIHEFMANRKKEKEAKGEIPFELRIGIHTGPVVAGVVGVRKYAYDIWGDTVNVAARMEQNSEAGKINISGSTYDLVKDKFACSYRGKIEAKNKGEIDMYFVTG